MFRWNHVTWSTYGVWLPGDPRGFRSRGGKIQSTGDYRVKGLSNEHAGLLRFSRDAQSRPPVELNQMRRTEVLNLLLAEVNALDLAAQTVSVSRAHVHALIKLNAREERLTIGKLKRRVSLKCRSWSPGGLWGEACWVDVIQDKAHFDAVAGYILNHAEKEKASVWSVQE